MRPALNDASCKEGVGVALDRSSPREDVPAALRSLPAAMYPVDRTGLGGVILACQTFSYVGAFPVFTKSSWFIRSVLLSPL